MQGLVSARFGGHVELPSGPTVYSLYDGRNLARLQNEKMVKVR